MDIEFNLSNIVNQLPAIMEFQKLLNEEPDTYTNVSIKIEDRVIPINNLNNTKTKESIFEIIFDNINTSIPLSGSNFSLFELIYQQKSELELTKNEWLKLIQNTDLNIKRGSGYPLLEIIGLIHFSNGTIDSEVMNAIISKAKTTKVLHNNQTLAQNLISYEWQTGNYFNISNLKSLVEKDDFKHEWIDAGDLVSTIIFNMRYYDIDIREVFNILLNVGYDINKLNSQGVLNVTLGLQGVMDEIDNVHNDVYTKSVLDTFIAFGGDIYIKGHKKGKENISLYEYISKKKNTLVKVGALSTLSWLESVKIGKDIDRTVLKKMDKKTKI